MMVLTTCIHPFFLPPSSSSRYVLPMVTAVCGHVCLDRTRAVSSLPSRARVVVSIAHPGVHLGVVRENDPLVVRDSSIW